MTLTQQFIEDAIAGGWLYKGTKHLFDSLDGLDVILRLKGSANRFRVPVERLLLDPSFFQAVGKTRGWISNCNEHATAWEHYWHRFIDHLADGKTIDEALQAIQ